MSNHIPPVQIDPDPCPGDVVNNPIFDGSSKSYHRDLPNTVRLPRDGRALTQAIAVRRAPVFRPNVTANDRTERRTSVSEYGAECGREALVRPADLAKHACIDQALLERIPWAHRETYPEGRDLRNTRLFLFVRALKALLPPNIPEAMIRDLAWFRFRTNRDHPGIPRNPGRLHPGLELPGQTLPGRLLRAGLPEVRRGHRLLPRPQTLHPRCRPVPPLSRQDLPGPGHNLLHGPAPDRRRSRHHPGHGSEGPQTSHRSRFGGDRLSRNPLPLGRLRHRLEVDRAIGTPIASPRGV